MVRRRRLSTNVLLERQRQESVREKDQLEKEEKKLSEKTRRKPITVRAFVRFLVFVLCGKLGEPSMCVRGATLT
jgi:hypothetical protein